MLHLGRPSEDSLKKIWSTLILQHSRVVYIKLNSSVLKVDTSNKVTFALTCLLTDYFLKLVSLSKYSLVLTNLQSHAWSNNTCLEFKIHYHSLFSHCSTCILLHNAFFVRFLVLMITMLLCDGFKDRIQNLDSVLFDHPLGPGMVSKIGPKFSC